MNYYALQLPTYSLFIKEDISCIVHVYWLEEFHYYCAF